MLVFEQNLKHIQLWGRPMKCGLRFGLGAWAGWGWVLGHGCWEVGLGAGDSANLE